ncbi:MAG: enoyl-CoA hydratase/isomerase family protein [Sphingomonadaceae bacterium]|nr:enoyl-CoA hydratase/isomerase family protein [Sphingomonadaceae bacterium]
MSGTVRYRVERGVSIVSLNRPERHNALDDESSALLWETIDRAIADEESRVVMLRGEGKSFCSGRDTQQLGKRLTGLSDFEHLTRGQARKLRLIESWKPVIAAVRGHAVGGGFELALQCDMRVAADDVRFSLPEIHYGILTDGGGSTITAALAGASRAKYLLMSGEPIGAELALAWGLVDFVTTPAALDVYALDLASKLAAKPPVHLAAAKYLVDGVHGERVKRGLRDELMVQTALFRTDDYQEARAARREKRAPNYTGR